MSHLTDGQLHAFLDGSVEALEGATLLEARSHIRACADCGARLEAARTVRDEAAALLDTAAPGSFSPPAFEALERRAARLAPDAESAGGAIAGRRSESRSAGGRLFRRPGSLAWAASLTVALTAGWLARGMVGPEAAYRPALTAPAESAALRAEQEVSGLDPSAESPSEPKERSRARIAPLHELSAEGSEMEEGDVNRGRGDRVTMDDLAPETADEEPSPIDDRPSHVTEEVEGRRLEMAKQEQARSGPGRASESELEPAAARMAQPTVGDRPSAALGAVDGTAAWQPVRRDQAEALLGGTLKTVEGLPILSVYARAGGAVPEVWTAQQLTSGHQLNLRQTPFGVDPPGDLDAARAGNEPGEPATDPAPKVGERSRQQQQAYYESLESLLVDGFLIEARAPLSPDSLRVLLSRLKD